VLEPTRQRYGADEDASAWERLAADAVPLRPATKDREDSEREERLRIIGGRVPIGRWRPSHTVAVAALAAIAITAAVLLTALQEDAHHNDLVRDSSRSLRSSAAAPKGQGSWSRSPSRRHGIKRHRQHLLDATQPMRQSSRRQDAGADRQAKPSAGSVEQSTSSPAPVVPTSAPAPRASAPPKSSDPPSASAQAEQEFGFER